MNTPLQDQFARGHQPHEDMRPHMDQLRRLAAQCDHVTEFGTRTGASTTAILTGLEDGGGGTLISYDKEQTRFAPAPSDSVTWTFHQADTRELPPIAPTDLLFIDTLHTYDQVAAELKHADEVSAFIVLHDTIMFGSMGEKGQRGITPAIYDFLAEECDSWRVFQHYPSTWGMLVLQRY